ADSSARRDVPGCRRPHRPPCSGGSTIGLSATGAWGKVLPVMVVNLTQPTMLDEPKMLKPETDTQLCGHYLGGLVVRFRSSHHLRGILVCELRNRGPLATL